MEQTLEQLDDTQVSAEYYFGYGVGPNSRPALEAVKTWQEDGLRRFDTFTIAEYDTHEMADRDEAILSTTLDREGLQAAMQQAEELAVTGGYLDPQRRDARVFMKDDAPDDPFETKRQAEFATRDYDTEEYPSFQLQDMLDQRGIRPLTLDSEVSYSFEVQPSDDPDKVQLVAEKHWLSGENVKSQTQVIREYDGISNGQPYNDMLDLYEASNQRGHQAALWNAERWANEAGILDPERDDPRLFTEGPPDTFNTLAERTAGTANPYWQSDSSEAIEADRQFREIEQFKNEFEGISSDMLTPLHPTVNYGFTLEQADLNTYELVVEKFWHDEQGELKGDARPLMRRDPLESEELEAKREQLLSTYEDKGLDALMSDVQQLAIREGTLLAGSPLFDDGPPERFTLPDPQQALSKIYPNYDFFGDQWQDPEPVSSAPSERWSFVTHNAVSPDGEPLGVSLSLVSYPPDFVDGRDPADKSPLELSQPEQDLLFKRVEGSDFQRLDDLENPNFRADVIEVAHFHTPADAERFQGEYVGYLHPQYVTAQELAIEVAQSEGLSGEFQTRGGLALQTLLDSRTPVEIAPQDWHPYERHAQRDQEWEMGHEPLPREERQPVADLEFPF